MKSLGWALTRFLRRRGDEDTDEKEDHAKTQEKTAVCKSERGHRRHLLCQTARSQASRILEN